MNFFKVIIEDYQNLDSDYVKAILTNVLKYSKRDRNKAVKELKEVGFIIAATLPYQFAEQKVCELKKLSQLHKVHLQCYVEEFEDF